MASPSSKTDFDAEEKHLDIQKQIKESGYEFDKLMNKEKHEKHEDLFKMKNSLKIHHDIIIDELNEELDINEDHLKENENTNRVVEYIKTYNSFLNMTKTLKSISKSLDSLNIVINNFDKEFNSSEYSENEENLSGCSDSSSKESKGTEFELTPFMECSCCNHFSKTLIQCYYCKRNFHDDCHIPALANNMDIDEWKCTICQDITKYTKNLSRKDLTGLIPVGVAERKLMERILMEFYCQEITAEKFRTSSLKGILYSDYYDIYEPYDLSLNVIKERLESSQSYSLFIHFFTDLQLLFSNAILYHVPGDPYYDSAIYLQNHLETLITKWIPVLDLSEEDL